MDEITLFAELKPTPPDDTAAMRTRARARLGRAISTPEAAAAKPRRRHRLALGLSVVAVAATAATVVPSVLFGGHSTTLATPAYAVTRGADGTVTVTIYDIATAADAAGLQRALRHEGVAALVWTGTIGKQSIARAICQAPARDLEPQEVQEAVVSTEFNGHLVPPGDTVVSVFPAHLSPAERAAGKKDPGLRFFIHPSAMPSGSALFIRRLLYAGPGGQPPQQEIGPPEVVKHDRLPC
ncbi:MAG TPA: hypothetical protein VGJ19_05125 [Streptosporangiaceae bacterium]